MQLTLEGEWRPERAAEYCYLFGLYLGDGCISQGPRSAPWIDIALDASYPQIINSACRAIEATLPDARVRTHHRTGAVHVCATHEAWPLVFPQHGPGRKHKRKIELADWQRELTHRHPQELLRGLYHSDGSRCINRFDTKLPSGRIAHYEYIRYFFTNYSDDIRRIWCEHCDLIGVGCTQSSFKDVSVSHRDSVAVLETFLRPKG